MWPDYYHILLGSNRSKGGTNKMEEDYKHNTGLSYQTAKEPTLGEYEGA
jgi:hypothetical protein